MKEQITTHDFTQNFTSVVPESVGQIRATRKKGKIVVEQAVVTLSISALMNAFRVSIETNSKTKP